MFFFDYKVRVFYISEYIVILFKYMNRFLYLKALLFEVTRLTLKMPKILNNPNRRTGSYIRVKTVGTFSHTKPWRAPVFLELSAHV